MRDIHKEVTAPPIVEAHYERNDEVLGHYTREQLDSVPFLRPEQL